MFTWECPTCGKELDVGTVECPVCHPGSVEKPPPARPPEPAPVAQAVESPTTRAAPAAERPAQAAPRPPAEPVRKGIDLPPRTAPAEPQIPVSSGGGGLSRAQIAIVAAVLLVAVGLAVYFARPGLFGGAGGLQLEDVPEAAQETGSAGTAARGDVQIAGIRTFYDGEYQPRVRAVVINHGESAVGPLNLEVQLRPAQASLFASPLASFKIELQELGPNESREIETELQALGTLAAIPPWDKVRIDLRAPSDTGVTADST